MRSFLLNKLVRTKIAAHMEELGQTVGYKQLDDEEFRQALLAKLREETAEIKLDDKADTLKELADVLEAVEALAGQVDADFDELRALQLRRRTERGGFDKNVFVTRVDMADDDPWAEYYAKEPDRFKEVS